MTPQQRFVRALAEYLAANLAKRSIDLQLQKPDAIEWSRLWNASPLRGYPDADEAERTIGSFLGIPTPLHDVETCGIEGCQRCAAYWKLKEGR